MSNNRHASYDYRAVNIGSEWAVFVVNDKTPVWWRLVAKFPDRDRAESYAVIENDCADEDCLPARDDEKAAPEMRLPVSRITIERFAQEPAAVSAPQIEAHAAIMPPLPAAADRNGQPWTAEEDAELLRLDAADDRPASEKWPPIALALGRTQSSVYARSYALKKAREDSEPETVEDMPRTTPKERRCLRCTKKFLSEHAGHRLCSECSTCEATRGISEASVAS